MVNKKICEIYERYKDRMDSYYGFLEPSEDEIQKYFDFFTEAYRNEKLLSFHSTTNPDGRKRYYAITDASIYYSVGFVGRNIFPQDVDWANVTSVDINEYNDFKFMDELKELLTSIGGDSLCDEDLIKSEDDFNLFRV